MIQDLTAELIEKTNESDHDFSQLALFQPSNWRNSNFSDISNLIHEAKIMFIKRKITEDKLEELYHFYHQVFNPIVQSIEKGFLLSFDYKEIESGIMLLRHAGLVGLNDLLKSNGEDYEKINDCIYFANELVFLSENLQHGTGLSELFNDWWKIQLWDQVGNLHENIARVIGNPREGQNASKISAEFYKQAADGYRNMMRNPNAELDDLLIYRFKGDLILDKTEFYRKSVLKLSTDALIRAIYAKNSKLAGAYHRSFPIEWIDDDHIEKAKLGDRVSYAARCIKPVKGKDDYFIELGLLYSNLALEFGKKVPEEFEANRIKVLRTRQSYFANLSN